jgi:hypothetical protein
MAGDDGAMKLMNEQNCNGGKYFHEAVVRGNTKYAKRFIMNDVPM